MFIYLVMLADKLTCRLVCYKVTIFRSKLKNLARPLRYKKDLENVDTSKYLLVKLDGKLTWMLPFVTQLYL